MNPAIVALAINCLAIFGSLIWIGQSLIALGIGKPRTLFFGAKAILVYNAINMTNAFSLAQHFLYQTYENLDYIGKQFLLDGADPRMHGGLYDSMLLFSSMSLVVMAGCAALNAYIRILRQRSGANLRYG